MAGIRGLGKQAATTEAEVTTFRKYLEQFAFIPLLNGQLVDCTIASGGAFVIVKHSLGRPYLGGLIAGVSAAAEVNVQTPEAASSAVDIKNYFVVGSSAALAADTRIKVWLF